MVLSSKVANDEQLYSLAIMYRDHKFESISVEESVIEAEKIFLKLAMIGNSNAMHNYASIQFKRKNFEKAFEYWSKSDLLQSKKNCTHLLQRHLVKQDLCLVVGSDRAAHCLIPKFLSEMHGSDVSLLIFQVLDRKSVV